ncbi:sortase B protein-sorting domain-containing protein [Vibrio tritonius]|uniref:Sortase B protein-sorting domain-containing protein n=1 Tax=Vibrio tritonius TaxID=1435069 RepID=A0ABS7YNB5_9VIBR|nr:sortase B protein-sorting domain-containing protein [Vibrio tritonius]
MALFCLLALISGFLFVRN